MSEIETLHRPFMRFLDEQGILYIRARSDVESTIAEGHPDFTLIAGNRCLMIEFKTKDGALSAKQKERKAALEKTGSRVHVIRDLAIAVELVQAWRSSLGEIVPVGQPKTEPGLVRFGAGVFRVGERGALTHIRVATAADAAIPAWR